MKTKKIFVVAGVLLLMSGIAINVKNALNEYGLPTASLHPNVQAQVGGVNGTTTGFGEQLWQMVDCKETSLNITIGSSSSSNSSGGSVGGGFGVGGLGWNANAGGTANSGTTTSTSSTNINITTTQTNSELKKYYCGRYIKDQICSITDPCKQ